MLDEVNGSGHGLRPLDAVHRARSLHNACSQIDVSCLANERDELHAPFAEPYLDALSQLIGLLGLQGNRRMLDGVVALLAN